MPTERKKYLFAMNQEDTEEPRVLNQYINVATQGIPSVAIPLPFAVSGLLYRGYDVVGSNVDIEFIKAGTLDQRQFRLTCVSPSAAGVLAGRFDSFFAQDFDVRVTVSLSAFVVQVQP